MERKTSTTIAKQAIFAMVEIKAAAEAFERGEISVFEALATIAAACEAYEGLTPGQRHAA